MPIGRKTTSALDLRGVDLTAAVGKRGQRSFNRKEKAAIMRDAARHGLLVDSNRGQDVVSYDEELETVVHVDENAMLAWVASDEVLASMYDAVKAGDAHVSAYNNGLDLSMSAEGLVSQSEGRLRRGEVHYERVANAGELIQDEPERSEEPDVTAASSKSVQERLDAMGIVDDFDFEDGGKSYEGGLE